jgi:hypothetical protein
MFINIIGEYITGANLLLQENVMSSYYRILTMVYNFQKYSVFGLYPSSWY